ITGPNKTASSTNRTETHKQSSTHLPALTAAHHTTRRGLNTDDGGGDRSTNGSEVTGCKSMGRVCGSALRGRRGRRRSSAGSGLSHHGGGAGADGRRGLDQERRLRWSDRWPDQDVEEDDDEEEEEEEDVEYDLEAEKGGSEARARASRALLGGRGATGGRGRMDRTDRSGGGMQRRWRAEWRPPGSPNTQTKPTHAAQSSQKTSPPLLSPAGAWPLPAPGTTNPLWRISNLAKHARKSEPGGRDIRAYQCRSGVDRTCHPSHKGTGTSASTHAFSGCNAHFSTGGEWAEVDGKCVEGPVLWLRGVLAHSPQCQKESIKNPPRPRVVRVVEDHTASVGSSNDTTDAEEENTSTCLPLGAAIPSPCAEQWREPNARALNSFTLAVNQLLEYQAQDPELADLELDGEEEVAEQKNAIEVFRASSEKHPLCAAGGEEGEKTSGARGVKRKRAQGRIPQREASANASPVVQYFKNKVSSHCLPNAGGLVRIACGGLKGEFGVAGLSSVLDRQDIQVLRFEVATGGDHADSQRPRPGGVVA
ncbi:hypothetical protein BDK51DRAFT_26410, partial [Blyttiomyces helicus]